MENIIRIATLEDIEQLVVICHDENLANPKGHCPDYEWIRDLIEQGCVVVCEIGGRVVGGILAEKLLHEGALMHVIVVDPVYRSQGIASELIKYFEDVMRKDNRHWILLYAAKAPTDVVGFYEYHGYTLGRNYIEMTKDLY